MEKEIRFVIAESDQSIEISLKHGYLIIKLNDPEPDDRSRTMFFDIEDIEDVTALNELRNFIGMCCEENFKSRSD